MFSVTPQPPGVVAVAVSVEGFIALVVEWHAVVLTTSIGLADSKDLPPPPPYLGEDS